LIDLNGETISAIVCDQVLLNEENNIGSGGSLFVRQGDEVRMIDRTGKELGKTVLEDARPFEDGSLAAVKLGGAWGFADRNGVMRIAPQYEDARSFRMGLAAVKLDGAWGFIDERNVLVIDCLFQDAKCFSDSRKAPVKMSDGWAYITLEVKEAFD
jgi:hypothetical protein